MLTPITEIKPFLELPYDAKVERALRLIDIKTRVYNKNQIVVAWSGGKASTVVLHMVRKFIPDVQVVFNDTGVEYPETYEFIEKLSREWRLNRIITKWYKKSFWDCIKDYGFTFNQRHRPCCYYLKLKPMMNAIRENKWKCMFEGMQAIEARYRMFEASKSGECSFNKKLNIVKVKPLLFWTDEDIWRYIRENQIPYNPLYDKGANRIGCMPCTAFISWKEQLSKLNPKMYRLVMNKLGQRLINETWR